MEAAPLPDATPTATSLQISATALMQQAIAYSRGGGPAPHRPVTVETLLALEKAARQARQPIGLDQLSGTWRLTFITGTQKSRQKAGIVLGAGRFLPNWIKIAIAYRPNLAGADADADANVTTGSKVLADPESPTGTVENRVRFAGVDLTVAGPIQLYPQRRILAFDFIRLQFTLGGIQLFKGYVKGGETREAAFAAKALRDQAFFTYFWVTDEVIAARGRGGGLAIWVRDCQEQ